MSDHDLLQALGQSLLDARQKATTAHDTAPRGSIEVDPDPADLSHRDAVERALKLQDGSVLACEVKRLRSDVRDWERQFAALGGAAGRGEQPDAAAAAPAPEGYEYLAELADEMADVIAAVCYYPSPDQSDAQTSPAEVAAALLPVVHAGIVGLVADEVNGLLKQLSPLSPAAAPSPVREPAPAGETTPA